MPVEANDAFTLILEPVKRCNLRCRYCYADVDRGRGHEPADPADGLGKNGPLCRGTWVQGNPPPLAWGRTPPGGPRVLPGRGENSRRAGLGPADSIIISRPTACSSIMTFAPFSVTTSSRSVLASTAPKSCTTPCASVRMGREATRRFWRKFASWNNRACQRGSTRSSAGGAWGQEEAIYRFFQALGYGFRVNPMVPGRNPEASAPYLLQPGEYGAFLCRLFDVWTGTERRRVPVSPLDLYLEASAGGVPYECQQQRTCAGSHLGVKPSGDVVLCSRFDTPVLGNIHDREIQELVAVAFL